MADETASKTERRPIVAPTTVGWRYTALIKERNCTQQELNAFLASEFASEARNVSTFLRDGVNASRAVRAVLIAFASTKLNVTLSESWFDVGWHSSAPIDTFATENSGYDSFIRSSCGKYVHVSAKARPDRKSVV